MHKGKKGNKGSILILTGLLLVAIIGVGALAVDFMLTKSYRQAVNNTTELMTLSAIWEYHLNTVAHANFATLSLQQQHYARLILGMRGAYNVYKEATDTMFDKTLYEDPFGGVNWNIVYRTMMTNIATGVTFPASEYAASKVRFLTKHAVTGEYEDVTNKMAIVTDPFEVRAAKVDILMLPAKGITPTLSKYFGFTKFRTSGHAVSEIANVGKTLAVELVIDRSLAMAGLSGDAGWQLSAFPVNDRYMGLSSSDRSAVNNAASTVQPMTDILRAARVVPEILGKANHFVDDPNRYSSLGIVTYDVVADAFPNDVSGGQSLPYVSYNTCVGCDHRSNAYKDIQDFFTAQIPVMGKTSLPRIENLCAFQAECRECFTTTCGDYNPPAVCGNFEKINPILTSARCTRTQPGGTTIGNRWQVPAGNTALPYFFPWTASDEGKGMEIAIEMIRQQKVSFVYTKGLPEEDFKGHIVLFSDGLVNAYFDRDNTADSFPQKCVGGTCSSCDTIGMASHAIRAFSGTTVAPGDEPNPPGLGVSVPYTTVIPAAWRWSSGSINNSVAWAANQCNWTTGENCPDIYHNGAVKYADLAQTDPSYDSMITPGPSGVVGAPVVDLSLQNYTDPTYCPGFDCPGTFLGYEDYSTYDSVRKPGIRLYCPDLAFMDFVDWADVNDITTHAVPFGDIRDSYNAATLNPTAWVANDSRKRQFLLTYASDAYEDGENVGIYEIKPVCASGCAQFKAKLEAAFVNIEARLT